MMKGAIRRAAASGAIVAAMAAALSQVSGPAGIRAQAENECTGWQCLCLIEERKRCWLWVFCAIETIPHYYDGHHH